MEFVVIALFVAAIVLVNFLVSRAQRKRAGRPAAAKPEQRSAGSSGKALRPPAGTSLETARAAVAQLDEQGHQLVYAAIAQGQPIRAIQIYAQSTGCGLRAASAAVASMASHPVPFTRPRQDQPPVPDAAEAEPASAGPAPADAAGPAGKPADTAPAADPAPEDPAAAGRETAARDAAARSAAGAPSAPSASGAAEKDKPRESAKDKEAAAPDDAEISRWAQNLRPEDF